MASYTKLPEVIISGLSHTQSTDLVKLVCCAASAVNLKLDPTDVLNVRRSGRRKEAGNTLLAHPMSSTSNADLSDLTVKLKSSDLAQKFVEAKRKTRRLHSSQLDSALLTAANAPIPQISALININENLPAPLFQLLMAAKHKARPLNYKYIWYGDGCIKVKYSDTSRIIYIRSEEDLNKILPEIINENPQNFRAQ